MSIKGNRIFKANNHANSAGEFKVANATLMSSKITLQASRRCLKLHDYQIQSRFHSSSRHVSFFFDFVISILVFAKNFHLGASHAVLVQQRMPSLRRYSFAAVILEVEILKQILKRLIEISEQIHGRKVESTFHVSNCARLPIRFVSISPRTS